jgi:hypothetical protein
MQMQNSSIPNLSTIDIFDITIIVQVLTSHEQLVNALGLEMSWILFVGCPGSAIDLYRINIIDIC